LATIIYYLLPLKITLMKKGARDLLTSARVLREARLYLGELYRDLHLYKISAGVDETICNV